MKECYEELITVIDDLKDSMIKDLEGFMMIPSITENRFHVRRALDYMLEAGKKAGFDSEPVLGGEVGFVETGCGAETLGILGHVDVVNEGEKEKWHTPPFKPVIRNGIIYGRGAIDDKGPVIASLYAMKAVKILADRKQIPFTKKVRLIAGTREEAEWTDMDAYTDSFPLPDYGFTPDGEFPVCNIEKGVITLVMHFPAGTDDIIQKLEGGTASNVVPGRCDALAAGEKIVVSGKAVHACQPEKGANAIMGMAEEFRKMKLTGSRLFSVTEMLLEKFSDPEGSALGLRSESEYYNGEFVHRNIFTPVMIRAGKKGTKVVFDIRYAYGTDAESIRRVMGETAAALGGKIESFSDLPPVYVSREKPFVKAFADAYENMTGLKNEYVLAYGGSYAKAMPNVVSWGPLFPGEEDTCHEENEYITADALIKNCRIFAAAIWDIVTSPESFR